MKLFFAALTTLALLASCAPSTPQSRIQQSPEKFARLTSKQKELVQQGHIARGMPQEGVELAWGNPSRQSEGSKEGKPTQRWDYESSRPVYTNSFFGDVGFGYGRYGRGHPFYSGYGVGYGPDVTYIPYTRASVWFVKNKVDSWERQK